MSCSLHWLRWHFEWFVSVWFGCRCRCREVTRYCIRVCEMGRENWTWGTINTIVIVTNRPLEFVSERSSMGETIFCNGWYTCWVASPQTLFFLSSLSIVQIFDLTKYLCNIFNRIKPDWFWYGQDTITKTFGPNIACSYLFAYNHYTGKWTTQPWRQKPAEYNQTALFLFLLSFSISSLNLNQQ